MFTFFHKKNEIVLDCFTFNPNAYELAPIEKSYKTFPDWWKNLPDINSNIAHIRHDGSLVDKNNVSNNMRRCFGFTEFFKRSLVIRSWTDFNITCTDDNLFISSKDFQSYPNRSGYIPSYAYGEGFKEFYHVKFDSPWLIKSKDRSMYVLTGAEWNIENHNLKFPPGCIEFRCQNQINVNAFIYKNNFQTINIHTRQPLVHLVPLTDKKIKIKNHLISLNEFNKMIKIPSIHGMNFTIKYHDEMEKEKSKCPFHFN
jgi:hypothetical protein